MRAIHKVRLDKVRPAVLLTRELAVPYLDGLTVAPITSRIRGMTVEVVVGPLNGLDHDSVVNCDTIQTVAAEHVGDVIGFLSPSQDQQLLLAILAAFDMHPLPRRSVSPPGRP